MSKKNKNTRAPHCGNPPDDGKLGQYIASAIAFLALALRDLLKRK